MSEINETMEVDCEVCDGTGVVCENHRDLPWDAMSDRADACGCGAGAPCLVCSPDPDRQMGTGKVPSTPTQTEKREAE